MAHHRPADRITMSAKPTPVRELSRNETLTSFLSWKGNLVYNLGLNPHFAEFLRPDARWTSRLVSQTRGLNNVLDHNNRLIASGVQRAGFLETMLGLIAGYCPILSRNIIVRDCNTMKEIFHKIGAITGLRKTVVQFWTLCQLYKKTKSPQRTFTNVSILWSIPIFSHRRAVSAIWAFSSLRTRR